MRGAEQPKNIKLPHPSKKKYTGPILRWANLKTVYYNTKSKPIDFVAVITRVFVVTIGIFLERLWEEKSRVLQKATLLLVYIKWTNAQKYKKPAIEREGHPLW